MPRIPDLPISTSISAIDVFPYFSIFNNETRQASFNTLFSYTKDALSTYYATIDYAKSLDNKITLNGVTTDIKNATSWIMTNSGTLPSHTAWIAANSGKYDLAYSWVTSNSSLLATKTYVDTRITAISAMHPVVTTITTVVGRPTYSIAGYTTSDPSNYLVTLNGIMQTPGTDYIMTSDATGGLITVLPTPIKALALNVFAFQSAQANMSGITGITVKDNSASVGQVNGITTLNVFGNVKVTGNGTNASLEILGQPNNGVAIKQGNSTVGVSVTSINFTGDAISAVQYDSLTRQATITTNTGPAAPAPLPSFIEVQQAGTVKSDAIDTINFIGSNVSVTAANNTANITIAGLPGLQVQNSGTSLGDVSKINFQGSGVVVSKNSDTANVIINNASPTAQIPQSVIDAVTWVSDNKDSLATHDYVDSRYDSIPLGTTMFFPTTSAPDGFAECDGRALSKTNYNDLYNIIGDKFNTLPSVAYPYGVTVDKNGNLYIADTGNHRIRRVAATTYIVTTVAGTGHYGKDNGTADTATFNGPHDLEIDSSGNIFITDFYNHVIRRIDAATGYVTTFAGTGAVGGVDGDARVATFNGPVGITIDKLDNLYITEYGGHTIRKITPAGVVSTFVGQTGVAGFVNQISAAARFNRPHGIVVDSLGNLFVSDYGNFAIRKITPNGVVTTLVGTGSYSSSGLGQPTGLAIDASDNLYVCEYTQHRVSKITPNGTVIFVAGGNENASGYVDGTSSTARFTFPTGIVFDTKTNAVYVADYSNHAVRKIIIPTSNTVTPYYTQRVLLLHGDDFTDKSYFANIVTPKNSITCTTGPAGYLGSKCFSFNGSSDFITIPQSGLPFAVPQFDFTGDFCVEFRVYFKSVPNFDIPLISYGAGIHAGLNPKVTAGWSVLYDVGNGNQLNFGRYDGVTEVVNNFGVWNPSVNTWYHIAITREGTNLRAFINGQQQGPTRTSTTAFTRITSEDPLQIGSATYGTGAPAQPTQQLQYLIAAGGGAGGSQSYYGGGGGGGGGVLTGTAYLIPGKTYNVAVGFGGVASGQLFFGRNGADSSFGNMIAKGGGGGGGAEPVENNTQGGPGYAGGSGGGGSGPGQKGGAATIEQGNEGGDATAAFSSAHGGGATTAGGPPGGVPGMGLESSIAGSVLSYGDGGPSLQSNAYKYQSQRNGGSGQSSKTDINIASGLPNRGGGGAGGGAPSLGVPNGGGAGWDYIPGNGGSGVVILSVLTTSLGTITGTFTTSVVGAYTIIKFTNSGTYTAPSSPAQGPTKYLNGYMDEISIVKGSAVYNASFTPPTAQYPDTATTDGTPYVAGSYAYTTANVTTLIGTGKVGDIDTIDFNTQFMLPDIRGQFIRGWDDGRGIDSSRDMGTSQDATGIRYLIDNLPGYSAGTYTVNIIQSDGSIIGSNQGSGYANGFNATYYTSPGAVANTGSGDNAMALVRPTNVAMLPCIKTTKRISDGALHTETWIEQNSGTVGIATNWYTVSGNAINQATSWVLQNQNSFVKKSGDTLSGPLTLASNAAAALQAVPKQQLDDGLALKANKAGETFTGPIVLPGNATQPLQAVPKQQLDTAIYTAVNSLSTSQGGAGSTLPVGKEGQVLTFINGDWQPLGLGDALELYNNATGYVASFGEQQAHYVQTAMMIGHDGKVYASGHQQYYMFDSTNNVRATNTPARIRFWGANNDDYFYLNPTVKVTRLLYGGFAAMALLSDGTVWVNGYNGVNLGLGNTSDPGLYTYGFVKVTFPVGTPAIADVAMNSGANSGTGCECFAAITTDKNLYVWGSNAFGQLGTGNTTTVYSPTKISNGGAFDGKVSKVSIGGGNNGCGINTMVITTDTKAWAAGYNGTGQLGQGNINNISTFQLIKIAISATYQYTYTYTNVYLDGCVDFGFGPWGCSSNRYIIRSNGQLWGAGSNSHGQLGDGTTTASYLFKRVGSLVDVKKMSFSSMNSYGTTCTALTNAGSVYTWGYNAYGQCGTGNTATQLSPVLVNAAGATDIYTHCGFNTGGITGYLKDNRLWSTGYRAFTQPGAPDTQTLFYPCHVGGVIDVLFLCGGGSPYGSNMATLLCTEDGHIVGYGVSQWSSLGYADTSVYTPITIL